MKTTFTLLSWLFTSLPISVSNLAAQAPGSVDTSFNSGAGISGTVLTMVVQADGKRLVGGSFDTARGLTRNLIARLNADDDRQPSAQQTPTLSLLEANQGRCHAESE